MIPFRSLRLTSSGFIWFVYFPDSLWAVVNLNLNRACPLCPVCTGLPDNTVYWPDPMVAWFLTIFCTIRRPNQTNIRQGSVFLAYSRRRANHDNSHGAFRLFIVPGLILGLFDRPHWLSPPWRYYIYTSWQLLQVGFPL